MQPFKVKRERERERSIIPKTSPVHSTAEINVERESTGEKYWKKRRDNGAGIRNFEDLMLAA